MLRAWQVVRELIRTVYEAAKEDMMVNPAEGTSRKMSKEEFIRKVSSLELSADKAIAELAERLHEYEKKYSLRSEVFYKLIVGTPAEDVPDFIAWAMCYRSYFRSVQSKLSIQEVGAGVV